MILVGDIHLGENEYFPEFIDYQTKELERVVNYAIENESETIWFAGDIFDNRQSINFKTFKRARTIFEKLKDTNIKVIISVGNHDVFHKNSNDIASPELIFGEFKNFVIIKNVPQQIIVEDTKCLFIPWINKENHDESLKIIKESDAKYAFGHLEINGFELVKGMVCKEGFSQSLFKKFDAVFSGHFHLKNLKDKIKYIGSLIQINWNDFGDRKSFYDFDLKNEEITEIPNEREIYKKIIIDENFDHPPISDYQDCFVKVFINCDTESKTDKWVAKLLENVISYEIINNSIILDDIKNLQVENEDFIEILKGFMEEQENMLDEDKEMVVEMLTDVYNRIKKGMAV
jgi:DNA repair exonuclease SbcCD nuclease subunit